MSSTLYIRLHREANVPGEACSWILRSRSGEAMRRGADRLERMPKASTVVGILSQDMVLTRTLRLPPGRRARTPAALANAIEPFLLSDPAANYVVALGDEDDGTTVVAAVTRSWLDSCVSAMRASMHAPTKILVESDLVPRTERGWTAICRADGGLLRTGTRHAETLDACAPGSIPEVLRLQLKGTAESARPHTLAVYADETLEADRDRWAADLGIDVVLRGPWDWALGTAPETGFRLSTCTDLMPHLAAGADSGRLTMRRWRLPLYLAIGSLVLQVGASVAWWMQRNAERSALEARIASAAMRALGPKEPIVDASVQTARALDQARRAAGEYATGDFVRLLAQATSLAQGTAMPQGTLKRLQYAPNTLTLEWENAPPATIERLASELKLQGLRTEVAQHGTRTALTAKIAQ